MAYLSGATAAHPLEIESGILSAIEEALAYRHGELSEIETFVLEEIRSHLLIPIKKRPSLQRLSAHAKHFYERQAEKFSIPKEEMFLEFSSIVDRALGIVSDEHYDRLHGLRVNAGLVDGKR